jgi:hypothetical protein
MAFKNSTLSIILAISVSLIGSSWGRGTLAREDYTNAQIGWHGCGIGDVPIGCSQSGILGGCGRALGQATRPPSENRG